MVNMAPIPASIRATLDSCRPAFASSIVPRLESGNLSLIPNIGSAVRTGFGDSTENTPELYDGIPGGETPTIQQVQQILLDDLAGITESEGIPFSNGDHLSFEAKKAAAANMISNVTMAAHPSHQGEHAIDRMPSSILYHMHANDDQPNRWPEAMEEGPELCSITPGNLGSTLHHNDFWTSISQLYGTQIWLLFPPTEHNLQRLEGFYAHSDSNQSREAPVAMVQCTKTLEGGLLLIQRVGTTLRIPPFYICTARTVDMTLTTHYDVYTPEQLRQRLLYFPLTLSLADIQHTVGAVLFRLTNHLTYTLRLAYEVPPPETPSCHPANDSFAWLTCPDAAHSDSTSALRALIESWGPLRATYLAELRAVPRAEAVLWTSWTELLSRAMGSKCVLCGRDVGTVEGDDRFKKHFRKMHWKLDAWEQRVADEEAARVTEKRVGLWNKEMDGAVDMAVDDIVKKETDDTVKIETDDTVKIETDDS